MTAAAVAGLAWVSVVSMLLGFLAWYQGLARGGVARVGRLQLAQPALTLAWAALLLGEHVSWLTGAAAGAVIAVTAVGRNARVDRAGSSRPGATSAVAGAAAGAGPVSPGMVSPGTAGPAEASPAAGLPGLVPACPAGPGGPGTAATVAWLEG